MGKIDPYGRHPAATRSTPPPSAPSKTFTIDIPIPAEEGFDEGPSSTFETLRETHEEMLQDLVDANELPGERSNFLMTDAPSSTSGSRAFSTPTPSIASRSVHGFSTIQPQFNLDSAANLLTSFKDSMLPYFPVIILPPDISVPALAKERPFVLLAILAAASGGRSLQGHNLYDEEFRKVLGLKFVSSGERSVELLIGLLIYCAWYVLCFAACAEYGCTKYILLIVQVPVPFKTKEQASLAIHPDGQRYHS